MTSSAPGFAATDHLAKFHEGAALWSGAIAMLLIGEIEGSEDQFGKAPRAQHLF